jgi:hypothetical protein
VAPAGIAGQRPNWPLTVSKHKNWSSAALAGSAGMTTVPSSLTRNRTRLPDWLRTTKPSAGANCASMSAACDTLLNSAA